MKATLFAVLFLTISATAIAQEDSLVTIYAKESQYRFSTGTGVVIKKIKDAPQDGYYSHVLTAAHVVEGASSFDTLYATGIKSERAKLVSKDEENDVAIIEAWTPNTVKPVEVGTTIAEGDAVYICSPRGITKTKISVLVDGEIYADTFVVSGDSGSPVFNESKQVVGVVSGGSFWIENRKLKIRETVVQTSPQDERIVTWPTRMGNIFSIRKILK